MNVVVSGGAGFIGSHLVDALLEQNHDVFVVDNLSTGSLDNLAAHTETERLRIEVADVETASSLPAWIAEADLVYHLAAAVGVKYVVEHRVHTIRTNLNATERILELASRTGTPVFVASTSEVYGKAETLPYTEDQPLRINSPDVGRWGYACSKAMGEFLALAYGKERDLPVVIGRLFNTTGPRQRGTYGMVLPRFVQQALRNEPLTVFGDGTQTRCFAHVTDVVGALQRLMATPGAVGRIFNIGSDEEVSIRALAERVRALANSHAAIDYLPFEQVYDDDFEDMQRRIPDLTRIRTTIGYRPQRSLDDIINDVIAFEQTHEALSTKAR